VKIAALIFGIAGTLAGAAALAWLASGAGRGTGKWEVHGQEGQIVIWRNSKTGVWLRLPVGLDPNDQPED